MLERISMKWNFQPVLYVGIGVFIIVQAGLYKDWLGVVMGGYLVVMGLFALGCAAGAGSCDFVNSKNQPEATEIEYEELKRK